jgi:pSer/pThr/pTyr-binding forkhead associated (FHA) protein
MSQPGGPHLLDNAGQVIPLARSATLLGRGPDCHVIIADRRASRRHAEVRLMADTQPVSAGEDESAAHMLRDLDSTNGTRLNGQRLTGPERLRDGDVIEIAGARFTFRDPDATLETTHFPKVVVDESTEEIWVDRCPLHLSGKQRALFLLLWQRRGHVCTKDEIAAVVWPECEGEIYDYQIESLVKRLRARLEPQPAAPALIVNVPGLGYRLAV